MHQVFRKPVLKMLDCSVKWSFNKVLLQTFEGIKICDMAGFGKPPDLLVRDRIVAALTLVKKYDTRRFRRLQRRLDYVVNELCVGTAVYGRHYKDCIVDLTRFPFEKNEDWYRLVLACTIIHEATHGEIEAWGIRYDQEHYLRVERLCYTEEIRFIRRVWQEAGYQRFGEFNEDYWLKHFQAGEGKWQEAFQGGQRGYISKLIRRFREAR